ncbi:MAG: ATP-binding protein [Methylococcales bacterium]
MHVSIKEDIKDLVVEIADNGIGITPEHIVKPQAFGIKGMQERAHFFGGTAKFMNSPPEGTTLIVRIPFKSDAMESIHD